MRKVWEYLCHSACEGWGECTDDLVQWYISEEGVCVSAGGPGTLTTWYISAEVEHEWIL